jgi:hypothetical protein
MVLAVNKDKKIRFLNNIGIDTRSIPYDIFPEKPLIQSVSNLVTESVAGFDIPVINDLTPPERLIFMAMDYQSSLAREEYQEINQDLAEALLSVCTADGSPLIPKEFEAIDFITPDKEFLEKEIYSQITKSISYRQFKRDNRDLFDEQKRILGNLLIRSQYSRRGMVGIFLSIRVDPTWYDRVNELKDEQIEEIFKLIQKEGNGGKVSEDEPTEETETKGEVVTEKNDSNKKSKDGQVTTGN